MKRKILSILSAEKPSKVSNTNRNISSSVFSRKSNCERRSAEQLHSSREQSEYIAQKQGDAMMILAEASKAHAEVATMNSYAMTEVAKAVTKLANNAEVQAVNDADRIRLMEKVIQVLGKFITNH